MPNVVRFALSTARTLHVPGAGTFIGGILDVDANNLALLTKTRYLVQPYRAVELGTVDAATPKPTLPAVPGPPAPDPYPQYLTPTEAASSPELRAAFAPISTGANISSLGTPWWTAHRCGGSEALADSSGAITTQGPYPENTMAGARAVVAAAQANGIPNFVLNVQVRELADGTLAAVHDTTVDRVTNASARVSALTSPAWAAAKVDTANWYGASGFGDLPTATLDDFLREFGGRVPINIGAYNSTQFPSTVGQRVADAVVARGLQKTVIIGAFQAARLVPAVAAGIATYYYPPDEGQAGADAATIAALSGVWAPGQPKRIGVSYASSDAYITSLVNAGLWVAVYNCSTRAQRDRFLALGVKDFVSNDVIYQATNVALAARDVDPYNAKVWPHGALSGTYGRGKVLDSGGIQLYDTAGGAFFPHVMGSRCPITDPTNYTLDMDFVVDQLDTDTSRYFDLWLGMATDANPSVSIGSYVDSYHIFWRLTGDVVIQKYTAPGTTGGLGGVLTTRALVVGDVCHLKIAVTPTTIQVTPKIGSTTYTASAVIADATRRGGYFAIGKSTGTGASKLIVTAKNAVFS